MDYLVGLIDEYGVGVVIGTEDMPPVVDDDLPTYTVSQRATQSTPQQQEPEGLQAANRGSGTDPAKRLFGDSFHIYGGKAVVCVSESTTLTGNKATISFEVAQRTGEGKAQWQDKISLMLTPVEQPLCLGVFLGLLEKMELKGHGKQQEKALTIVNQGKQFFLTMIMRGQSPRAVPIPPEYAYPLVAMLMRQMQKNDPHMTSDLILQVTRQICEMRCAERRATGGTHG